MTDDKESSLRSRNDFRGGVRGKYVDRVSAGFSVREIRDAHEFEPEYEFERAREVRGDLPQSPR